MVSSAPRRVHWADPIFTTAEVTEMEVYVPSHPSGGACMSADVSEAPATPTPTSDFNVPPSMQQNQIIMAQAKALTSHLSGGTVIAEATTIPPTSAVATEVMAEGEASHASCGAVEPDVVLTAATVDDSVPQTLPDEPQPHLQSKPILPDVPSWTSFHIVQVSTSTNPQVTPATVNAPESQLQKAVGLLTHQELQMVSGVETAFIQNSTSQNLVPPPPKCNPPGWVHRCAQR